MYYFNVGKMIFHTKYRGKRIFSISSAKEIFGARMGEYSDKSDDIFDFSEKLKSESVVYLWLENLSSDEVELICSHCKDNVKYIEISATDTLGRLDFLSECHELREVTVWGYHTLRELWNMAENPFIDKVTVSYGDSLESIDGIKNSTLSEFSYEAFDLCFYHKLDSPLKVDLSIFTTLKSLKSLAISLPYGKRSEKELAALSEMKGLKSLKITKYAFSMADFAKLKAALSETEGLGCVQRIRKDRYTGDIVYALLGYDNPEWIADDGKGNVDEIIEKYNAMIKSFEESI